MIDVNQAYVQSASLLKRIIYVRPDTFKLKTIKFVNLPNLFIVLLMQVTITVKL